MSFVKDFSPFGDKFSDIIDPADLSGKKAGQRAYDASIRAADMSAKSQQDALDYLRQREAVPQEIRDNTLRGLSSYYQIPGAAKTQDQLISEAKSSPLYAAILGSRKSGEDSINRNASATGMLRSGNTIAGLSDYNMNLENNALLTSYNHAQERDDYMRNLNLSGLSGLAQLPSNANNIANATSGIGSTQAMGLLGGTQGQLGAEQAGKSNLVGLGSVIASFFSDLRLKSNVEFKGYRNGYAWYSWEWIPEAIKLGLEGKSEGVLAHQVYEINPEAVGERLGFITVDYAKLGLAEAA